MVSTLVALGADRERMRVPLTWLGLRHVRYGVRPHHIPVMGQVRPACAHAHAWSTCTRTHART
jgi:hypothetical protein